MVKTFEWTSAFETGLAEIDEQHRGLVDILNAIGDEVSSNRPIGAGELETLHRNLLDYAAQHFADEEELMEREGVAIAFREVHEQEHRYYIREIERLFEAVASDGRDAGPWLLRFLSSWLAYHILGIDQSLARQVANIRAGDTPEQALHREEQARRSGTEPLLDALHTLFNEVAQRNERLRALNEGLEQEVAQRTAALTQAVERLEAEKVASQRLTEELAVANRHLEELAMTDALTGLANRRNAMAQLDRAWNEGHDGGTPMSLIMVDADGFKSVNDRYGHDAGDAVIIAIGKELRNSVRTDDVVCRMGGDEFLILCPRTKLAGAVKVAEQSCQRVRAMRVRIGDHDWHGSVSLGVASRSDDMTKIDDLVKAADDALYEAKQAGRNRVASRP